MRGGIAILVTYELWIIIGLMNDSDNETKFGVDQSSKNSVSYSASVAKMIGFIFGGYKRHIIFSFTSSCYFSNVSCKRKSIISY